MKIQFLGATRTVTGSKYLITTENKKVLVDCGLYQGLKQLRLRNWEPFPGNPAEIDAIILTHAHLDHSGYLPIFVKNGFRGKIYCSHATKDLAEIILADSGHLMEEEAKRANKYGYSKHKVALPLYTRAEAEAMFHMLNPVEFHQDINLASNLQFRLNRAGHILGAATVFVKNSNTSILFSGDLGRGNDPCIFQPENILSAEYLVLESTYGDRLHEKTDPQKELAGFVNRIVKRGGSIIIPAFAVGRTQSLLYDLYVLKQKKEIADIPVFLDSPMAQDATEIFMRYPNEHKMTRPECAAACSIATYVNSVEESKKIDANQFPKIIISASGMAVGGRVLHHIKAYAGDVRSAILFSGYQAAGTRGEALMHGIKKIKIFGEVVEVNAEVTTLHNTSAHVDYQEMLAWLKDLPKPPRKVFITHGEEQAANSLKEKIEETYHWNCVVPEYLQTEQL